MPRNKYSVKAYRIQNLKKAIELSIQLNAKKRERIYGVGIEKLKDEEGGWFVGGRDPKRKRDKWYGDNTIFYKGILIRKGKLRYSDKSKGYFYIEKPEGYEGDPDIEGKFAYWSGGYLFYEEKTTTYEGMGERKEGRGRDFAPQFIIKDGVVREVRGVLKGTERGKYNTKAIKEANEKAKKEKIEKESRIRQRENFKDLKLETEYQQFKIFGFEKDKAEAYLQNITGYIKGKKPETTSFSQYYQSGNEVVNLEKNTFYIKNSRGEKIPSKDTPYLDEKMFVLEAPDIVEEKKYVKLSKEYDYGSGKGTIYKGSKGGHYRKTSYRRRGKYFMRYVVREGTTQKEIMDYVKKFFTPNEKQIAYFKKQPSRAIAEEIKELQRKKVEVRKPKPVVVEKAKRPRLQKQEGLQGLSRKELNSIASKLKKEKKIKTEGKMKDKNKEWLVDFIKKNR